MTDLPTRSIDIKAVLSGSSPTAAMDDHSEGMSYLESVPRRLVTLYLPLTIIVFILLFLLGIGASGYISWELLQKNAQEEVAENARLMMTVALAVRSYTSQQIKPLLTTQMVYSFLPQSGHATFCRAVSRRSGPPEICGASPPSCPTCSAIPWTRSSAAR